MVETLEIRRMFCFDGDGNFEEPLQTPAASVGLDATHPTPDPALGFSYTFETVASQSANAATAQAASAAGDSAAASGPGYVPLAPTASPLWETGYFAPTGTVDLQAGAALAPDVTAGEAASLPRDVPINANGLPLLESRTNGAGLEMFVDFARNDGTYGTFSLDGDRSNFSFTEQSAIYNCWRNLVGFFSQFNVNVTTVLPATGASDPNFAWIQVTNEFSGGAAYVNWLAKDGPKGHVNSDNATNRVSGIAHEFGHILGLNHEANFDKYGNLTAEYSNGDGYRNVPTMGIDYNGTPSSRFGTAANPTAPPARPSRTMCRSWRTPLRRLPAAMGSGQTITATRSARRSRCPADRRRSTDSWSATATSISSRSRQRPRATGTSPPRRCTVRRPSRS
jgi:hypothetical protein